MIRCPTNPKPKSTRDCGILASRLADSKLKSTAGPSKSTVDLGRELLIQVENGLQTLALQAGRHSLRSTTMRQWGHANQIPANAGQKFSTCNLQP
jgi:hypothetical protein